jgi:hypothetical protein
MPFEGVTRYKVARQHIDDQPPLARSLVPDLTEGFEQLLWRLLRKDPADRFATQYSSRTHSRAAPLRPQRAQSHRSHAAQETITVPSSGASHGRSRRVRAAGA